MPGRRLASFWEGNRAELLATYVLSSVAAVTPVPVQVDFGLDLLCTLTHKEGRFLYTGQSFGVQVKSISVPEVKYGGVDKKGKWKEKEVRWLFEQDQPILLCIVDQNKWKVSAYSTNNMWYVIWRWGWPGEIVLVPNMDITSLDDHSPLENTLPNQNYGNKQSFRVPLGKPIFEIELKDQNKQNFQNTLRKCLEFWIFTEYQNITYRKLRVPYTIHIRDWSPNIPPKLSNRFVRHYWNPNLDQNIKEILESISPAIASLIHNLNDQGQADKVEAVIPLAKLTKNYGLLDPSLEEFLKKNNN